MTFGIGIQHSIQLSYGCMPGAKRADGLVLSADGGAHQCEKCVVEAMAVDWCSGSGEAVLLRRGVVREVAPGGGRGAEMHGHVVVSGRM